MKEMIKNTLILTVITLIAGCLLGLVNDATKDTIKLREEEAKISAYKNVFDEASAFDDMGIVVTDSLVNEFTNNGFSADALDEVIMAKDTEDNLLGYVFTVTSKEGYGGDITFTVGIKNDGTVNGISLLSINETAGLGMNAEKVLVPQFANKKVGSFEYTKTGATAENEIDAISGATITTRAITNGVNLSLYYFKEYLGGGVENE